jgi:4-hydroxy-3-methylbut-2-enyl diphosphate reductase
VVKRLLLASPRGYCAGVERAVETVERALALYGRPVYVRKQIVHNSHVVEDLRARGAVFVDALLDVPEGATVVFSAHGIAPAVRREADELRLTTLDATCPLVTKVHAQRAATPRPATQSS